ncbi:dihydrofolate reductase [Cohaesibacter celericrescens]|uniref:Dihydrofolate reductase n=1 Tax=Cohaesibacter celericrescens TaxID=2067669 RepID=A0A2N5XWU0_9HYPH|nr:dihydrofolate reductase [Cohaesibacter celericrescens]PLW75488.1 diacylglycerol kinase [Cohaesibacter celericrescens]PLW78895.1 diacylglycerol kinase [Cohaesibacter celericrescens]
MTLNDEPKLVFHYAVADNGVIGKDNGMPWHVSSDLKRFKAMTMGKPIIMGRRTFQSIGRALPGRVNFVVTADQAFSADGVVLVPSVEDALSQSRAQALLDGVDEIAVIGGGTIYNALWDKADRLYVTHIHAEPQGDTHLPAIDEAIWHETSRQEAVQGENDSAAMSFVVYERQRRS